MFIGSDTGPRALELRVALVERRLVGAGFGAFATRFLFFPPTEEAGVVTPLPSVSAIGGSSSCHKSSRLFDDPTPELIVFVSFFRRFDERPFFLVSSSSALRFNCCSRSLASSSSS